MKTALDLPDERVSEPNFPAVLQGYTLCEPGILHRNPNVQRDAQGLLIVRGTADAPAGQMSIEELLALETQAQADEDSQQVFGAPVDIHAWEEPGS
ncbi:hypothetical protein [Acidithiobacillus sp.]|jgi:hypothetical protein|uniref:hypothetical protein n=1 Tax=Acidithiobacillus sp. TaxID=1872118 RepID=UPI0035658480